MMRVSARNYSIADYALVFEPMRHPGAIYNMRGWLVTAIDENWGKTYKVQEQISFPPATAYHMTTPRVQY